MSLSRVESTEITNQFKQSERDCGSTSMQVAMMSSRIKHLTEHFKIHKKDFHSRRGLQQLVNKRKKLLKYLKRKDMSGYQKLIQTLGLRDSY